MTARSRLLGQAGRRRAPAGCSPWRSRRMPPPRSRTVGAAPGSHPDQALHLPDAGRPDLRQLLRHVSRRGRAAGRDLPAAGDRRSHREMRQAVPAGQQRAGAAWRERHDHREPVGRREDGRLRRGLPATGARRRHGHGLLQRERSCPSTGKRRRTTCSSTTSSPRSSTASGTTAPTGSRRARHPAAPAGYRPAATGTCRRSSTGCRRRASAGSSTCRATTPSRPTSRRRRPARKPRPPGCRSSISSGSPRTPSLASHIVGLDQYYRDLAAGTLPAVAYVASSSARPTSAPRSPYRPARAWSAR